MNGWQFYAKQLNWEEDGWVDVKGRWDTPKGKEGDLYAPPTSIVCIRTEPENA